MWHGVWVCCMLWSTRATELWLQHKVTNHQKSWVFMTRLFQTLTLRTHFISLLCNRRAGSCSAVLGIGGVTKLRSVWWHSWVT
jgi:hypothetical protein